MKKLFVVFMLNGLAAILISCTNEKPVVIESPTEPIIQNPLIVEHNNQEFKIINHYQEFLDFLEIGKKQPDNLEELYKETVGEALRKDGFGYNATESFILTAPTNIEALEESVHTLIDQQGLINGIIIETLKESADQLPGGNKSVYVLPANPDFASTMKEVGNVTGVTWNKNSIVILIHPNFLEKDLKHTIAHEYHHAIYMSMENAKWFTLLEQSIIEGKADTFAGILYPEVNYQYQEPLSGQMEQQTWKIFNENVNSTDTSISDDFYFGNRREGIPQFAKYKIGNQIMESFLAGNPNLSIVEWTKMPAEEILVGSEYRVK